MLIENASNHLYDVDADTDVVDTVFGAVMHAHTEEKCISDFVGNLFVQFRKCIALLSPTLAPASLSLISHRSNFNCVPVD